MQRIGLAASKISKGNIWFYHLAVVLISCLFGLFVFLLCGFFIAVAILVLSLVSHRFLPSVSSKDWMEALKTCLTFLGVLVALAALVAIVKNIRLKTKL